LLFAVPGCRRDAVTHDITTFLGGSFAPSDPASLSSQPTRSKPLSIAAPPQALGLGDTCTASLRLRAGRSATMRHRSADRVNVGIGNEQIDVGALGRQGIVRGQSQRFGAAPMCHLSKSGLGKGAVGNFWATGPEIPRDFSVRRYLSASLTAFDACRSRKSYPRGFAR
jgi:hypothetical protein